MSLARYYIAGGFNKAKVDHGGPAVGNRYVIIRYENEAAYDKFYPPAANAQAKSEHQEPVLSSPSQGSGLIEDSRTSAKVFFSSTS